MKFNQILSLLLLSILLFVLINLHPKEYFVCPKTLSDRCSGRFTSKNCEITKNADCLIQGLYRPNHYLKYDYS